MDRNSIHGSSSSRRNPKYDVFLSFRGEDSCNNFTDHLFDSLQRKGISTFRDDKSLKKGDSISPELLKAIEHAEIFIVVFSKNYADSTWCLEELAKISEGINERGYTVVPIFYDVGPSEVRHQSESFAKAFAEHEERFRPNLEKVQRWRRALTKVADLVGWDVQNKLHSKVIDAIATEAFIKLRKILPSPLDNLVGMQSRAEALENLLDLGSDDVVRVVGICGMVGIGKTTLASVVYERISHQFDACCFLANVSKHEVKGLLFLQEKLLWKTLKEKPNILDDQEGTNLISTRLKHLKTIIVVDDVDHPEQLQKLAGKSVWFGVGSRIIITTRDEHILREHRVDKIYKVQPLNNDESLQLFCRKAFKRDVPETDFQEMTHALLELANGLPIEIVIMGSFLRGRGALEWRDALHRLERGYLISDLLKLLQTSFDSLEAEEKEIFLDIACFFEGAEENYVMEILNYCVFHPAVGVRVLLDKSIISIVNGTFRMQKSLQRLGWHIALGNPPDGPAKWSRLWLYDDFQRVLETNTMLPNLRSMDLHNSKNLTTMPDFRRMPNLERLNLEGCTGLSQLHPSIAILPKLKFLNLNNCINLVSIPDSLFGLSSLKLLNLAGCSKLAECLDFDSWRSSIEVKVLSNEDVTLLEVLSYNILISFPEKMKNKLVFGCLSCLMDHD